MKESHKLHHLAAYATTKNPRQIASPADKAKLVLDSSEVPTTSVERPVGRLSLSRLPAVLKRVAMGRTALYALIKAKKFPAPVKVGGASAWVDAEVSRWIEELINVRDQVAEGG